MPIALPRCCVAKVAAIAPHLIALPCGISMLAKVTMETAMANDAFYFDDLRVGQRFETATHTITEAEIKAFAAQFDPQPFHLDNELARASLFGGLAASGWHTASITMRLMVDLGIPAGGLIGASGEIAWPRPTRPGDVLRVVSEVVELTPSRARNDRGSAVIRNETRNHNDEIVQVFIAKTIVFRRPDGA